MEQKKQKSRRPKKRPIPNLRSLLKRYFRWSPFGPKAINNRVLNIQIILDDDGHNLATAQSAPMSQHWQMCAESSALTLWQWQFVTHASALTLWQCQFGIDLCNRDFSSDIWATNFLALTVQYWGFGKLDLGTDIWGSYILKLLSRHWHFSTDG